AVAAFILEPPWWHSLWRICPGAARFVTAPAIAFADGRGDRRGPARGRRGDLRSARRAVRRVDAAGGADVRPQPRRRGGVLAGGLARRAPRDRQLRGSLLAQDLDL